MSEMAVDRRAALKTAVVAAATAGVAGKVGVKHRGSIDLKTLKLRRQ